MHPRSLTAADLQIELVNAIFNQLDVSHHGSFDKARLNTKNPHRTNLTMHASYAGHAAIPVEVRRPPRDVDREGRCRRQGACVLSN